ncbi:MAG TPA: hypothetical protein VJJ79_02205 [Candidatus Nanoarchaeia archaeon]|nr:hypothetical protein [Candidatus Nanoarchaeia archaeon]
MFRKLIIFFAVYLTIDILLRTEKKLKLSYQYILFAWVIFAVGEIAVIGEEILFWKLGHYRELFILFFILLFVTRTWFARKTIHEAAQTA